MRSQRYEKYGYRSEALHLGEDGAVATLEGTACGRLNLLCKMHGIAKRFGIHPSKRKSDSQVRMQVGRVMTKHKACCLSCWPASKLLWNAFGFPSCSLSCMHVPHTYLTYLG